MFTDTIRAKRNGKKLASSEIEEFVAGLVDGTASAEQAAAFAMAICLKGMDARETTALTMAKANSGMILEWDEQELGGPVLDKHSTGGIGDKVSLLLAPVVAACGGFMPMLSGRGLGHTGGTLDKLEAIPGYSAVQSIDKLRQVVRAAGCAIVGASEELAPADRILYAIRDLTATVDSVPLITASILAKKIAGGICRLLMDVKVGNGAFMQEMSAARELSRSLVDTAAEAGIKTRAIVTDMNQPLGCNVGNGLEVAEVATILTGDASGDPRLMEVTLAAAAHLLCLAGLADNEAAGKQTAATSLTNGQAAEAFGRMVKGLGGPADFLARHVEYLHQAPVQIAVHPVLDGTVASIDTLRIGEAVVQLGGGRVSANATIDHSVGFSSLVGIGGKVGANANTGPPLCVVHARNNNEADRAADMVRQAYATGGPAGESTAVVLETVQ